MHQLYPIKRLNSWRTGSQVKYYSKPDSREALCDIYDKYYKERTIWLGLGSNILFPDSVLEAHIIHTTAALREMYMSNEHIYVEAGVSLGKVAKLAAKQGYVDASFLAGIPGTLGGALKMNAGAYGHEIWQYVESVDVLTQTGVETVMPNAFEIGYRHVILPKDMVMFLSAKLRFEPHCHEEAKSRIKDYLIRRNRAQPIGTYNCGSVFTNPDGMSTGRMIDQLGLLGYQIGGARISPKHGNFIENIHGEATTKDIWSLIYFMQERIWQHHQVRLKLEVTVYDNI